MKKNSDLLSPLLMILVAIHFLWWMPAYIVFTLRHPWATPAEKWMNPGKVLLFKKVSLVEFREGY